MQHTKELGYTQKTPPDIFLLLQFLQLVLGVITSIYCKSKNVLLSVKPFFIGQANDLSANCRDVVVVGHLQTEVLEMMDETKKGDRNKDSLSSSRSDV